MRRDGGAVLYSWGCTHLRSSHAKDVLLHAPQPVKRQLQPDVEQQEDLRAARKGVVI